MNRNTVKDIVVQIKKLAESCEAALDTGSNYIAIANELACKNISFVFGVGELYATEQVKNQPVKCSQTLYRDSKGRFVAKPKVAK